jgi:lipase chaperone LimK
MRKFTVLAMLAFAAVLLFFWLPAEVDDNGQDPGAETAAPPSSDTAASAPGERVITLLDIPIRISASGDLVQDTRIKQLFDRFAAEHTEEPVDSWKQSILQTYADQLPAPALAQLQELLNRYVEFNLALQLLPLEGAPDLNGVLARVRELREHYLGKAASDSIYADWSALEKFTHQYLDIMTRNRDPAQSEAELEDLARALPEPVQERALSMIRHNDEEMSVQRIAKVDPVAYGRMLQEQAAIALNETQLLFDEPSPEFMERYEQYAQERQAQLQENVDLRLQQDQLKDLRAKYFSGADQLRVETLDRAEAF